MKQYLEYWCSPDYPGYPSNALPVLVYSFSNQNSYFTFVVLVLISITHLIKVMIFSEILRMLQNFFFVSAAAAAAAYLSNSLAHFPGYERYHDIIKWVRQRQKKCTFCSHMTCTSINISTVCQKNAFLHHYIIIPNSRQSFLFSRSPHHPSFLETFRVVP